MVFRDQLQSTLGDAYTIERELTGGGMSRVYVALDRNLGRPVVVKLLDPDIASGLSISRFEREIRMAATLQHPCIVPVLTAGESNGVPFYTMPLVDGRSLRQRLADGQIPIAEIVRILRDVASALAAAHARGIVHRDIKPENVLLSSGYAMVTDFGIAKALTLAITDAGSASKPEATLTQLGMALGTPQYMSPEQISGDPDVDHRADIYAFGCVAYELLAGQSPFGSRSPAQLLIAHLSELPVPVEQRRADVPRTLAVLVMKCLAKDAVHRPQRADELVAQLETVTTASVAVASPATTEVAVAVLPFTNLSSDQENEYLSDGITEDIIGTLSRVKGIRVAGRGSSFAFKGKQVDPKVIAEQLKVTYLVEGSVRKQGNKLRVTAELLNGADGFSLWSERFDRELTDIFAVQDEIAAAIAAALRSKLVSSDDSPAPRIATPAPAAKKTQSAEAYELYLRGVHVYRNQIIQGGIPKALSLFEQALAIDPTFAKAHVYIGLAYNALAVYSLGAPHEVMPKAAAAAKAALAIDPDLADGHMLAGYVAGAYEWDWVRAEAGFTRALALAPNDPEVLGRAQWFEASRRHDEKALEHNRRAREIDPLNIWSLYQATALRVTLGRCNEALHFAEATLELNPHHAETIRFMGLALYRLGRLDEALAATTQALALSNRNPHALSTMVGIHAARGERDKALPYLHELVALRDRQYVSASSVAFAYWTLGQEDEAVTWLDRAVDERDWICYLFATEVYWDEQARSDDRIQRIVKRVGIPVLR